MKKSNLIFNGFFNNFLPVFIVTLSSILLSAAIYISGSYEKSIDEMIYYLFNGMNGTSTVVFITGIKSSLISFFILLILLLIPIMRLTKRKNIIEISFIKYKNSFSIFPLESLLSKLIYSLSILISSLIVSYHLLGINEFVDRMTNYSTFIDDNYITNADTELTSPTEKRNLIILYLESMETTFINTENGGAWNYPLIPELTNIAKDNINFSHTDHIGGAIQVPGTGWTVAGLVATTAGIPLKIPIDGNSYNSSESFLGGAYTLGDALKENGYNLKAMFGSDASFGGRSNYYTTHGKYEIFDLNTAIKQGKMLESEKIWWGFDDSHLFEWAKEEIIELADKEDPFSFSFLTANTHFPDGHLEDGTEIKYDTKYENVIAHSSKQIAEFVNWLQEQDFYKNTTLVLIGDHLSMQDPSFFESHLPEGYTRTTYNAFINSPIEPINTNNRLFTPIDMYPTILASIGVKFEGERLGIGTNLFSDRETIVEEFGYHFISEELAKNSNFYNKYILQDDYINLLQNENQ